MKNTQEEARSIAAIAARNVSLVGALNRSQKDLREEIQIADARLDGHDKDLSILKSAIKQIQEKVFEEVSEPAPLAAEEPEVEQKTKRKTLLPITKISCHPLSPEKVIIAMDNPQKTWCLIATQQVYDEVIKPLQEAGFTSYIEAYSKNSGKIPTMSSPDQSVSRAIHAEIAVKINHLPINKKHGFKTDDHTNIQPSNVVLLEKTNKRKRAKKLIK